MVDVLMMFGFTVIGLYSIAVLNHSIKLAWLRYRALQRIVFVSADNAPKQSNSDCFVQQPRIDHVNAPAVMPLPIVRDSGLRLSDYGIGSSRLRLLIAR